MKILKAVLVIAFISFVGYTYYSNKSDLSNLDVVLHQIESLARNEDEWGCAGNPTWVPNSYLGVATCWSGASHKKCKNRDKVCCDPSLQTDCK